MATAVLSRAVLIGAYKTGEIVIATGKKRRREMFAEGALPLTSVDNEGQAVALAARLTEQVGKERVLKAMMDCGPSSWTVDDLIAEGERWEAAYQEIV